MPKVVNNKSKKRGRTSVSTIYSNFIIKIGNKNPKSNIKKERKYRSFLSYINYYQIIFKDVGADCYALYGLLALVSFVLIKILLISFKFS